MASDTSCQSKNYDLLLDMMRDEWGSQEIWIPSARECLINLFQKINLTFDNPHTTKMEEQE